VGSIDRREGPRGVRYDARWRSPDGRQRSRAFTRKRDAQAFLASVETAKNRGDYIDPRAGHLTLGDWFDRWAPRQQWAARTGEGFALAVAPWRDVQLRDIDRAAVEHWVAAMAGGYAALTVRTRLGHLRQVLRAAVVEGMLPRDPTAGVRLPRAPSRHDTRIPTAAEVGRVLEGLPEPHATMALVCAQAGLRLGEVCGLQVGDVDAAGGVLRVRRQAVPERGNGMVAAPVKSASSVRDVPVPAELVERLAGVSGDTGDEKSSPDWWLFPSPRGVPYAPSTMHTAMARACDRAGVSLGWHSLRHFYASSLLRQGLDVVTVARALGHSSPAVTLNVYAHVMPDATDRTRTAAATIGTELAETVRGLRDSGNG
jgi:integrase